MPRSALLPLWEEVACEAGRRWGFSDPPCGPKLSLARRTECDPTSVSRPADTSSHRGRRVTKPRSQKECRSALRAARRLRPFRLCRRVGEVAALAPGLQSALQGPDAFDAVLSQEQRHTGAGSFVGSSTVKNDFAIARQAVAFFFEFPGFDMQRSGNNFRLGFEVHRMTEIHDCDLFPRIDFFL